jgi:D-alanyl-lipoteichoic acid acyltransferase DltB (MBOAT superfamily)
MQNLDFLTYYNYLLGFYTLLAGPIQRYDDFVSELRGNEGKCVADKYFILQQISRILTGVIKFAVLARLFQVWGGHLGQLLAYHAGLLLAVRFVFAMYMYFFYIYLSFSGYCDIVIGVAALSGVRLPENFDRPYMARNQIEFWERWHMTLSAWIKDYLFNPFCKLLLSKWQGVDVLLVGILGYFVAFFIAGIWHGNTLNFVFFGVLLGAGVAAVKIYEGVLKKLLGKNLLQKYRQDRVIRFVATAVSLTYFTFCLLFFDNTPGTVIRVLRHVIGLS